MNSNTKLKWRTDLDKQVIIQNFEKRGWIKSQGEGGKCTCNDIYLCRRLEHILGECVDGEANIQP